MFNDSRQPSLSSVLENGGGGGGGGGGGVMSGCSLYMCNK